MGVGQSGGAPALGDDFAAAGRPQDTPAQSPHVAAFTRAAEGPRPMFVPKALADAARVADIPVFNTAEDARKAGFVFSG